MIPIIGIAANIDKNRFNQTVTSIPVYYTESIERAGAIPIIIPFTKNYKSLAAMTTFVHGFIFPGGLDITPEFYNEIPEKTVSDAGKDLDLFQLELLRLAMADKKPVLAICRGAQLVNIALGGTLIQDIPSQFPASDLVHMQKILSFDTDHAVEIEPESRLHKLFGPHIRVNSRHHQSIKTPGKGLVITARATDGVIEAAQHETLPMDLIQWHPELLMQKNNAMLPLFNAFIERCSL